MGYLEVVEVSVRKLTLQVPTDMDESSGAQVNDCLDELPELQRPAQAEGLGVDMASDRACRIDQDKAYARRRGKDLKNRQAGGKNKR